MSGRTHFISGIALSATVLLNTNLSTSNSITFTSLAILGVLLPDIDAKNSIISKMFPLIYKIIGKGSGHRCIFHDFYFYIPLFLITFLYYPILSGLCFGIVVHFIFDMVTVSGLPYFYIFNKKKKMGLRFIKSCSKWEIPIAFLLIMLLSEYIFRLNHHSLFLEIQKLILSLSKIIGGE